MLNLKFEVFLESDFHFESVNLMLSLIPFLYYYMFRESILNKESLNSSVKFWRKDQAQVIIFLKFFMSIMFRKVCFKIQISCECGGVGNVW